LREDGAKADESECQHVVTFSLSRSLSDFAPDPDVVFLRSADGWAPVSFQNAIAYGVAVTFHDEGTIEVDEKEQADLVSFCNLWMRNIREQQGMSVEKKG
jgi:hypothetical protein